jgi:penicillin-binding protein 1A
MKKGETGGRSAGPAFANFVKNYIKLYPQTKRKFDIPKNVKFKMLKSKKLYFTDVSPLPNIQENQDTGNGGGLIF